MQRLILSGSPKTVTKPVGTVTKPVGTVTKPVGTGSGSDRQTRSSFPVSEPRAGA